MGTYIFLTVCFIFLIHVAKIGNYLHEEVKLCKGKPSVWLYVFCYTPFLTLFVKRIIEWDNKQFRDCIIQDRCTKDNTKHCSSYRTYFSVCHTPWTMNSFTNKEISIGCRYGTKEDWKYFFSDECTDMYCTPRDTEKFKLIKKSYEDFRKQVK